MTCCSNPMIANISAKCNDTFAMSVSSLDYVGYVPRGIGIGGGDYLRLRVCLRCGQLQDFSDDGGLDEFIEDYLHEHGEEE